MSNKLAKDNIERRCGHCKSDKTYMAVTKNGTQYPKWNSNPFKEDSWLCGRCYRYLLYHKALPPIHIRKSIRIARIAKRECHNCRGKTTTQGNKTSSSIYHIWHRHPTIPGKWLCGKCYANWHFEPKRKFKTKEERYQFISKLFSGTGNPMYGNHTLNLGRVYTDERNKKVSEAVKKWAKKHREHYHRIGVLGALKTMKMGLSGIPSSLEIKMEKALKNHNIQYIPQYAYGRGIMDFYLPEGNIALFADGGVWHADPRIYEPNDALFFKLKTSKKELKSVTAKEVWEKDRIHNNHLRSKGYTVIRFWEKEIKCEIDKCIEILKNGIQAYSKRNVNN